MTLKLYKYTWIYWWIIEVGMPVFANMYDFGFVYIIVGGLVLMSLKLYIGALIYAILYVAFAFWYDWAITPIIKKIQKEQQAKIDALKPAADDSKEWEEMFKDFDSYWEDGI